MKYLLDANVLIAVSSDTHPDHEKALTWIRKGGDFLICPIAQGALVRYFLQVGHPIETARNYLLQLSSFEGCTTITDDLTYDNANLEGITGHKQVTDVYLAELAKHQEALLATLDQKIALLRPDLVFLVS
ncbi:PIN domain-containing protein [Mobiluncus porci]|uniref:Ribonuclease VapC n=1 Tax=Mobiluncus porci TaxID=2652278 RepID=A0A7K0K1F5_9ACTO|nr:PIN domain-containing protein [Mobiluncus porci]MST49321.1 PIN domain-containing protein [Mobiluncus porci]